MASGLSEEKLQEAMDNVQSTGSVYAEAIIASA
jgi:hypothetical protein